MSRKKVERESSATTSQRTFTKENYDLIRAVYRAWMGEKRIHQLNKEQNKLLDELESAPQAARDEVEKRRREVLNRGESGKQKLNSSTREAQIQFRSEFAKSLLFDTELTLPLDSKGNERIVPDERLFVRLAEIGRISAGAEVLREGISQRIDMEWQTGPIKPKHLLAQLNSLTRSSSELFECLKKLTKVGLDALWEASYEDGIYETDEERRIEIAFQLAELTINAKGLASLASRAARSQGQQSRKAMKKTRAALKPIAPGRLSGFTLSLLWEMRFAGGKLTLDKNLRKGTLADALNLLRPYLPPRFIPKELPFSTLARIKSLDQKIALSSADHP